MNSNLKKAAAKEVQAGTNAQSLKQALVKNERFIISQIGETGREEFGVALEALASNDRLMEMIPADQVVRVAANATSLGVSVNPFYKECDILPFNTNGTQVASMVIKKKGLQEICYNSGFFLDAFELWKHPSIANGKTIREDDMSTEDMVLLKKADKGFVQDYFQGWDFILEDISSVDNPLPKQEKFIAYSEAQALNKNMQAPDHSQIPAFFHKAARRAFSTKFFMPRARAKQFAKLEQIDNQMLAEVEVLTQAQSKKASLTVITESSAQEAPKDVGEDVINGLLEKLKAVKTAADLSSLKEEISDLPDCSGKEALKDAWKQVLEKCKKESQTSRPTYASIRDLINKCTTKAEVNALTGDINSLPEDQSDELALYALEVANSL